MKLITPFLKIQQQLRIFHWQTESYAQHKAFGKAYEEFDDLIDTFVEAYIGKYGKVKAKLTYNIELDNLTDNYMTYIDDYITYLISLNNELDSSKDSDLLNIRDEMLAVLNRLKYLLSFLRYSISL
jgi:DNA-binding ferritin-like protein